MRKARRLKAEMNVVPYIDVMLVLLIIFMVTAPMIDQGVEVRLPEERAETLHADEDNSLTVTIDANGQYYNDAGEKLNEVSLDAYMAERIEQNVKIPVILKADQATQYRHVMHVMVKAQQFGASNVSMITAPPSVAR